MLHLGYVNYYYFYADAELASLILHLKQIPNHPFLSASVHAEGPEWLNLIGGNHLSFARKEHDWLVSICRDLG